MPFQAEEKSAVSAKWRSSSPPVIRRSSSTERGSFVKGRIKIDAPDNPPVEKVPFRARVPSSKTPLASLPSIPPVDGSLQGNQAPFEQAKTENVSDILYGLKRVTLQRVPEHEEEQYKKALNVRQGGIRKPKPESKVKIKNHVSAYIQKSDQDVAAMHVNNTEQAGNKDKSQHCDLQDADNEVGSAIPYNIKPKTLHRNNSRDSQNMEPR